MVNKGYYLDVENGVFVIATGSKTPEQARNLALDLLAAAITVEESKNNA